MSKRAQEKLFKDAKKVVEIVHEAKKQADYELIWSKNRELDAIRYRYDRESER